MGSSRTLQAAFPAAPPGTEGLGRGACRLLRSASVAQRAELRPALPLPWQPAVSPTVSV